MRAQFKVGLAYSEGQGFDRDASEALKWYRLAADQGYIRAQEILDALAKPWWKFW